MMPPMTVSVVTGAGRGIGRAIALELAKAGHGLVVTGRTAETVRATADEVGGTAVVGDVTDPSHAAEVAQVTRDLGGVDVLVNNAGLADTPGTFLEAEPAGWWRVVETNLHGPMLMCHALLPQMVERGAGRVVNLNSMAGMRPFTAGSAYSISKAGLARLTDILAATLEDTGVRVFDFSPGLVHTDMADSGGLFVDVPEEYWTPMDRAVATLVALVSGRYDGLAGRFVHAEDDLDALLGVTGPDARRLRLAPAGDADPLFADDD
jgi:NAD(P)-dependent dehydrogenase (short-subunit alcohol dehydrogenase family)